MNIKSFVLFFITALLSMLAAPSFAVGPDFTTLTAAVDYSTVITAILGIFASLAGVYIVTLGGSLIISKIRGGR